MATTVKAAFEEFATSLNITDRQEKVVSTCHQNVVNEIKKKLYLHPDQPSKLIGSYDRDTLIRYLNEGDVDIMIVLDYSSHKDWDSKEGATKALESFKTILKSAYISTECNIDRNCVTMKLNEFRLDVVPAFKSNQGGYFIPDTYRGVWLQTDPVKFSEEVTRINKNMDQSFVPLIKMMKGWNKTLKTPLRGFHLECIMLNHYKNYSQAYTYPSMIKVFLAALPAYLGQATYDPISGDQVDLYLNNTSLGYDRQGTIGLVKKEAAMAEEALNDSEKYPSIAIGNWRKLLGQFFPAYG